MRTNLKSFCSYKKHPDFGSQSERVKAADRHQGDLIQIDLSFEKQLIKLFQSCFY